MMRHTFALSCTQQKPSGQQAQRSVQSVPGLKPSQQAQQQKQVHKRALCTAEGLSKRSSGSAFQVCLVLHTAEAV